MPFDLSDTRAQLKAIEQMPNVYTFLTDTFAGGGGEAVEDDKAIYDYRKGQERMAPFVVPGTGGVPLSRDGYETREIGFCCIAPERIVTWLDINRRSFGEDILGAMTPEQRARKLYARDVMDLKAAIARREEWMCRSVLIGRTGENDAGKLEIFRYTREGKDKETTLVADYGFTNYYTPATPWGQDGARVIYDLDRINDIVQEGLGTVDVIVMDTESAAAAMYDETFRKQLDTSNFDFGDFRDRYRGQGVYFLGRNASGVEMYSFAGKFMDDDGEMKPQLPRGTLIAGSRNMLRMPYGPVTQVEGTGANAAHRTYIKRQVPLRYGSMESNAVKNRLTSCPTVVPNNVDGWVVGHMLSD